MQVMLIGKNKVHKIVLPQVAIGDYWITDDNGDFEKKLVNIKGTGECWKISSDKYAEVLRQGRNAEIQKTPENQRCAYQGAFADGGQRDE